jgi:uncharacterized membrane protein YkvA (DUF1232 family)
MPARPTSWLARPWLLRALLTELRVALRLLRDPSVPLIVKTILPGAALYLVWPIDLLPDFLPGLGQIDDLAIAIVAVRLFLRLCPVAARAFHEAAVAAGRPFGPMPASERVVDAEFRRE